LYAIPLAFSAPLHQNNELSGNNFFPDAAQVFIVFRHDFGRGGGNAMVAMFSGR
jgi:hypothetical protein